MCADGGTDAHKEGDQRQPVRLVALVKVAVVDEVRELALISVPQIHQQEVVKNIDGCERFVELKAVEQGRHAVEQADVAQNEIAMAAPDLSGLPTLVKTFRVPAERLSEQIPEFARSLRADQRCIPEPLVVDVENGGDPSGATMGEADHGALVQFRDLTGQLRHELACQGAIPRHGVEESVLLEPSHLDDRIDQWARPSEDQAAVMFARDGPHAKVQIRCGAPVKLDLSLARGEPLFRGRKVEVGIVHGTFQFERAITGQEDQGGMRRDELDLRALRGEKRLEEGDHVALVANQHDTSFHEVFMRDLRQDMGFAQDANKDRLWGAMPKQPVTVPLLAMALLMLAADLQNSGEERGYALIRANCSGCHAVGRADVSPLPDALPLREVHQRYPVEHLAEALAEGLVTGHPGKPAFRFDAQPVDDIIEYLKSLER